MRIAADSETALIDAGLLAPPMACLTWCGDDLVPHIRHAHDPETPELLESWLKDPNVTLVGGNFSFDLLVFARQYPHLLRPVFEALRAGRVEDIQINQRLVDNAQGMLEGYADHLGWHKVYYSVAALSERHGFGKLEKDLWRLRYSELIPVPMDQWPQGAKDYALLDAKVTKQIDAAQSVYADWLLDAQAQARAAFALHLQSDEGLRTDAKACREYIAEVEQEIRDARGLILKEGLLRPAGTRNKKAAQARMEQATARLGIEPKRTKKDGISLDEEACLESLDPVLIAYSKYSNGDGTMKRVKKLSYGATQKLQTSYVILKKNGRTSSRTPQHPLVGENFQNLPTEGKMRECFVPVPGYYFNSVDYNQFELAAFAQIQIWKFGKSKLADAINAGKDVHSMLAAVLLGKSYEWVVENKHLPEVERARDLAKRANFGLGGGMGKVRFAATVNAAAEIPAQRITEARAAQIKSMWLDTWEVGPYFEWISELTADGPCTIRQYVSGRVRGRVGYCDTANGFFSGLAADAVKATLLPLAYEGYVDEDSPFYGSRPLLLIHDEVLAAVPIATAHEAAYRQTDVMLEIAKQYIPDVKVTAAPALMERWYKRAKAVHDANGRLIPWHP